MRIERLTGDRPEMSWAGPSSGVNGSTGTSRGQHGERAANDLPIPNFRSRGTQRGYSLAALLVILTILAVVLSFSVPRMWSDVMRRERELQTIFAMKQYAQAIADYRRIKGTFPTKLEELEKATMPRVLRSTYVNPLSGELDWIMVPEGTLTPASATAVVGAPGFNQPVIPIGKPPDTTTGKDPKDKNALPPVKPRDFSGPFIGVRPPQSGPSMIELWGRTSYEDWMYTLNELEADLALRRGSALPTGAPNPGTVPGTPKKP